MKTDKASKALVTTDFHTSLQTLGPIPQETIDKIVKDAVGTVTWMNHDTTCFGITDTVVPLIKDGTQYVPPYSAKWRKS